MWLLWWGVLLLSFYCKAGEDPSSRARRLSLRNSVARVWLAQEEMQSVHQLQPPLSTKQQRLAEESLLSAAAVRPLAGDGPLDRPSPCRKMYVLLTQSSSSNTSSHKMSVTGASKCQEINTPGGCYRNSQKLHLSIHTSRWEKEVGKLMSCLLKTKLCVLHVFPSLRVLEFPFWRWKVPLGLLWDLGLLGSYWSAYEARVPLPNG